ncbi:alpha/beta hydrolase, partial [Streptomyces sp. MP131-18]|uniref:alpha/beta hydrolase n=1 Tax=Streptomyces sp. MP131-18 TaxID=1857892 RepID=UPI00097C4FD9
MRKAGGIRAVAVSVSAAVVLATAVAACSGGAEDMAGADGASGGADAETSAPEPNVPSPADVSPDELPELPATFTEQTLDWSACPAPSALQGGGDPPGYAWECADLLVPLDYTAPDNGETIEIALVRARSLASADRIGSLVFNFGGPGGSGVAALPHAAGRYEALRAGYDLVSFDPRGTGESDGVVCRSGAELDAAAQADHGPPRTAAEERQFLADSRAYAQDCEADAGALLPHVTTADAARDLDLLRHTLGDSRLHYVGISYGTKLGAVHAHLFPDRVGRTVLDAVVDPTRDLTERALLQAEGFQLALDNYLADCAEKPRCPTGVGGSFGHDILTGLLDGLRERPLPTATGRDLTVGLATTALLSALYSQDSWPFLTDALRQALDEDRGDLLLAAAEQYNGRDSQGRYRNIHAANNAINCADFASRPTLEDVHAHQAEFAAASPVFGETLVWSLMACADWPVTGAQDRPEVSAPGAGPILLLGTTGDPATPYVGAERMRQALGEDTAVLLTYDGEGHGAHSSGNTCVTEAVERYLLAGTVPRDGTTCR